MPGQAVAYLALTLRERAARGARIPGPVVGVVEGSDGVRLRFSGRSRPAHWPHLPVTQYCFGFYQPERRDDRDWSMFHKTLRAYPRWWSTHFASLQALSDRLPRSAHRAREDWFAAARSVSRCRESQSGFAHKW
jgi:hypothetical protein